MGKQIMTYKQKNNLLYLGFLALSIMNLVVFFMNDQSADAVGINVAGRQRMLSQKISKEALLLNMAKPANRGVIKDSLASSTALFSKSLSALINGGDVKGMGHVNPPKSKESVELASELNKLWGNFKPHIEAILNSEDGIDIQKNIDYIKDNNIPLLKKANELTGSLVQDSRNTRKVISAFQVTGNFAILILITFGLLFVNIPLGQKLSEITDIARKFSLGVSSRTRLSEMTGKDEIGKLAQSFLDMQKLQVEQIEVLKAVAHGDLTKVAPVASESDNFGKSLNKMIDRLGMILNDIGTTSEHVLKGAIDVSDVSMSLSQGATEQAATIEEISSSVTLIADQTKDDARNAKKVNEIASDAHKVAKRGEESMASMKMAMININESSIEIRRIIKAIDDIAFQTNLLALNAAVEAARAGQHGRGFAVVAEEVRNLATRSAKAAKETSTLIEESVEKVNHGSKVADETAKILDEIMQEVAEVNGLVSEIADSTEQQAISVNEANIGLRQLQEVTQLNASTSEQTAAASDVLHTQANGLQEQLSQFRINEKGNEIILSSQCIESSF